MRRWGVRRWMVEGCVWRDGARRVLERGWEESLGEGLPTIVC